MYLICNKRVFKTAKGDKLVAEDVPAAAFLVATVGQRRSIKDLTKEFPEENVREFFVPEAEYVPPTPQPEPAQSPLVKITRSTAQEPSSRSTVTGTGGKQAESGANSLATASGSTTGSTGTGTSVNPEKDAPRRKLPE